MSTLKWKYVSPLKRGSEVDVLELKYCYRIPDDLRECIERNNAGVPSLTLFDMDKNRRIVFGGLLSYNEGDMDSIYDYLRLFEIEGGKRLKMLPFALDPAGNFFCIKDNKVVFYDHEVDKETVICNSFSELINKLHA